MQGRIVITGMGVVSPNGVGLNAFRDGIESGRSGITRFADLERLKFRCQVGGIPPLEIADRDAFLQKYHLEGLMSSGILYGCMAAVEAWGDAGYALAGEEADWASGVIFGTGSNGVEATKYGLELAYANRVRDGDPRTPQQAMNSGVSAYIGGIIGAGNKVTSNASACNTGTEAILMACEHIKAGRAERMLVGSSESGGPYVWGPFDAMFATAQGFNDTPEQASRPLDKFAAGFVPSAGAGALVLESLESALKRNARIYAEVLGGHINSGGQRGDGTMTIGNTLGMVRCIEKSMNAAGIEAGDIDFISGHLSSTVGDSIEITSWSKALKLKGGEFPYINAMKSMIGHCLSASGSVETVATVLQLYHGFVHPSLNSGDLHPEIAKLIDPSCVPQQTLYKPDLKIAAKISLGFGDVNSCILLRKWGVIPAAS